MRDSIQCDNKFCSGRAMLIDHETYRCDQCGNTVYSNDEPIPRDRVHYFEDEDLFPDDDENRHHYCIDEDDEYSWEAR